MDFSKFIFRLILCTNFFIFSSSNEFFQCLQDSKFFSDEHCNVFINKWDRLPSQITPIKYRVTIQPFIHFPNEKDFYFQGSVHIEFRPEVDLRHILLHSGHNLMFKKTNLRVTNSHGRSIRINSVNYISSRKWLLIKLDEILEAGRRYNIHIHGFTSKFPKLAHGFYWFSYEIDKKKRYGANTLLSPFYARNVFPCFDDPVFVALIQLTIIRPDGYVSQSIMEIRETKDMGDGWFTDIYEWTLPIQTYQFTFSVNTFDYTSEYTSTGHEIRVWAPKEKLHLCSYSLGKIKSAMEFYEKYFNTTYIFNKLDIAVTTKMPPYETGSSTYGLLILDTSLLFIDDEKTLPRMKQIYVNNINHEIAHQWIGNILKMEWFDALWVIEGLVGYMEQKFKTHQTQYDHRLATALTQNLVGLFVDNSDLNHKLSVYPYSAKHVEYYFDDLIFTKGFSLFKMIEGIVGENRYRLIMMKLLQADLKPMTGNEIWRYMDKVLDDKDMKLSIEYVMKHWQSKSGFPIVHAKIKDNNLLMISQRGNFPENAHFIWPIPITYLIKNGEERSDHRSLIWLNTKSKDIELEYNAADDDWFVINQDQIGFFRVNYELSNWMLLIHQLRINPNKIPPISRLQIVDDVFELYCTGDIPGAHTILEVLSYMENEKEYTIWKYSKVIVDLLNSFFDSRDSYKYFKAFMRRLISNLVDKIQWTRTKYLTLTIQMRDKQMMTYACRYELPYCQEKTDEYFDYWLKDHYFIAPLYLYGPIICNGVKNGNKNVWFKVWEGLLKPEMSADQKIIISQSLACSKDEKVLDFYWDKLLNNKAKFEPLYSALLSNLAKNVFARPLFERRLCSGSVNLTKNPFEFAATVAALNNFMLDPDCEALRQLHAVRFKRSTGDNLETESALNLDQTRWTLFNKHIRDLEEWLKINVNEVEK